MCACNAKVMVSAICVTNCDNVTEFETDGNRIMRSTWFIGIQNAPSSLQLHFLVNARFAVSSCVSETNVHKMHINYNYVRTVSRIFHRFSFGHAKVHRAFRFKTMIVFALRSVSVNADMIEECRVVHKIRICGPRSCNCLPSNDRRKF